MESPRSGPTVSAAIIALNEEHQLPKCLESLRWCDEVVVVVDAKTTDNTAAVAERYGAKVFHRAVDGHREGLTPQKNFALAQCTSDWIFSIDADEHVPPDLREEILATVRAPRAVGYYVSRRNIWLGRWIRHGGWFPDHTLRLFRRGSGEYQYMAHERIEVDGPTGVLRCSLVHSNNETIGEHLGTTMRATDLEAHEMIVNGMRFYPLFAWRPLANYARDVLAGPKTKMNAYLLAKKHFKNRVALAWAVPFLPLLKFTHMYVVKQGYRDGTHGYWLAVLSAIYVALKYAKYWAFTREPSEAARSGARRGNGR
jgi:glycosyltransferase involved in cell wall biosynthesis